MTRPKYGPNGRNRWQGRGRMDLLCAYPAQPHVITKFHEGKLNSSYLCFSEKERKNLVTERRKFHLLDWSWKQYTDGSCPRPWLVYGVVQSPRTPLAPTAHSQSHKKGQKVPEVHLQPERTSMVVFISVTGTARLETRSHTVGLVVSCDCCTGLWFYQLQKIHSDLWLCVKVVLSQGSP